MTAAPMTSADVPTLAGARLVLRRIRPDDLDAFLGRERDPEIVRMRGGEATTAGRRPTRAEAERWYEAMSPIPTPTTGSSTSETARLVLAHASGPGALHRVDLRVLAYNARAIACYRACGFVEEGREREAALVDGTWHDFVIMSILESDLKSPASAPRP